MTDYVENTLGFARDHLKLLEKFGRYPHRNKILGRESTEDEAKYLKELEEK